MKKESRVSSTHATRPRRVIQEDTVHFEAVSAFISINTLSKDVYVKIVSKYSNLVIERIFSLIYSRTYFTMQSFYKLMEDLSLRVSLKRVCLYILIDLESSDYTRKMNSPVLKALTGP